MSRPTTLKLDGTVYWTMHLYDADGVLIDATGTPAVTVRKDAATSADVVTVTKRAATTGIYDCSHNPAAETIGMTIHYSESAVITAITYVNGWSLEVVDPFDSATDAVANVTLVATTTTNTDMRGTDSANTVVPPSVAQFDARTILAADYFAPATDAVANVTLVATTTTNTDMRGTDGANTVVPSNASIALILADTNELQVDNVPGLIAALNDFNPAVDVVASVTLVGTTTTNTDLVTAAVIADAVWDEVQAGHVTAGTTGEALNSAGGGSSPATIAAAVWDATGTSHVTAGTFGYFLDAQVSSAGAGGSGLYQVTVRAQDAALDSLQGARVNVDGTTLTLVTDSSGEVVFNLDSGVYLLEMSPPAGYDTPTGLVVTVAGADPADTAFTLTPTPSVACDQIWVG